MEASTPVPSTEQAPTTAPDPLTPPRIAATSTQAALFADPPPRPAPGVGTPISPPAAESSDAQLRDARAADILNLLFSLKRQRLVADYSCAISDQFLMHGRLYVTEDAVCFYSNIFGRETRRILPFQSMLAVRKRTAALVISTLVFVMAPKSGGEKEVSFASFFGSYRDDCYDVCARLLQRHRPEASPGVSGTGGSAHVSFAPQRGDDSVDAGTGAPGAPPSVAVTSDDGAVPSPSTSSRELRDADRARKRSGSMPSLTSGSFSEGSSPTPRAAMSAARPSQLSRDDSDDVVSASPSMPSASLRSRAATAGLPFLLAPLHVDMPVASDAAREVAFSSPAAVSMATAAPASPAAMATETAAPVHPSLWTRLGRMKVQLDLVLPVSIADFHAQCIADTSTFSIADYHKEEGDYNVTTSPWVKIASGTPAAQASREVPNGEALVTRTVRLVMPLKPGPFMPKETSVEKVQRFAQYAGPVLVVDTFAKSFDVPFGDYFVTEDTWLVCPVDSPVELTGRSLPAPSLVDAARAARAAACGVDVSAVSSTQLCRIVVLLYVSFSKSTMFKSRIVAQAEFSVGEFYNKWALRVRSHLTDIITARASARPVPLAATSPTRSNAPTAVNVSTAARAADVAAPLPTSARSADAGSDQHDRNASTASVPLQAVMRDFLSPTMAAEMAVPRPRVPHDELIASFTSPSAAADAPRDRLLHDYVQLYASHEALLSQVRHLQQEASKVKTAAPSLLDRVAQATTLPDNRMILYAIVMCLVAVFLLLMWPRSPSVVAPADPQALSAMTEEIWARLQHRMAAGEAALPSSL